MFPRMKWAVLYALLFSLSLLAWAANARSPLGGTYSINRSSAQGKTVTVTMSFRLVNISEADLKNATLMVADHQPGMLPSTPPEKGAVLPRYNNHGTVNLPVIPSRSREVVIKDATFTIPAIEFQQWKKGEHPVFVLTYQAEGRQVELPTDLVRRDEPTDLIRRDGGAR